MLTTNLPVGVPGVPPLAPEPDPRPPLIGGELVEDFTLDVICRNGKRGDRKPPIERLEFDLSNRSIPIEEGDSAGWDF